MSEGHIHETHGHKTPTSPEHQEEKLQEDRKDRSDVTKGISNTCSSSNYGAHTFEGFAKFCYNVKSVS